MPELTAELGVPRAIAVPEEVEGLGHPLGRPHDRSGQRRRLLGWLETAATLQRGEVRAATLL